MIALFLADGFEEAEAICPLDLMLRAGLDVRTVSVSDDRTVKGAHGVGIVADMTAAELEDAALEAVVLPGGMPGADNLKRSPAVLDALKRCAASGGITAAICAAPIVLAEAGLSAGKQMICYPGFEKMLTGAAIRKRAVVVDGRTVTGVGPGAAFEFGLTLVRLLAGQAEAERIERAILPV